MLMTCLSYAGKPEGRSERRTDMKPMKEIYLAGGCFWGTEHFLKQIEGVEATRWICQWNIANPHLSAGMYRYHGLCRNRKSTV
mgnify:CR=1 FL=1